MNRPIALDPADLVEAGGQYLAERHGYKPPGELHPYVDVFRQAADPLKFLAEATINSVGIGDVDRSSRVNVLTRALSSSVFSDILAYSGRIAARTRISQSLRDVRQLCSEVELSDYKPASFPILETEELGDKSEGANIEALIVRSAGQDIQIEEDVRNLLFTRQTITNDDLGVVNTAIAAVGAAAARRLAVKLVALLEDNAALADGTALFSSTYGNDLTSAAAPSVSALEPMTDALRNVETPDGEKTNSRPKFVVVPSSLEITTRVLVSAVNDGQHESDWLRVVALPWLGSSYWYLVADPVEAPSLALATLAGGNGEIVTVETLPEPRFRELGGNVRDVVGFRVRSMLGVTAVSRSIVRNTLA